MFHADLMIGDDKLRYAKILKNDAARAGFKIHIKTAPASQIYASMQNVPLGITRWQGRPLGTMILNLVYASDKSGHPVTWNETRWTDKEFNRLLKTANGTLDVDERRKIFCELERIQMERGSIGLACWQNIWIIMSQRVHDAEAHPMGCILFNKTWLSDQTLG